MNTAVHLLYRDACNFKTGEDVVFSGAPTPELEARLRASLEDGESLSPAQVGLVGMHPALRNSIFVGRFPDEMDDHGYLEVCDIGPSDRRPTDQRSFAEFVAECEAIGRDGWDPDITIAAVGGWQDPEKCARLRNGE